MLLGDTGLFNKAQQSEDEFKIGALKDQISTIILDWELGKKIPNTTGDETIGTLDRLWDKFVDADIIDNPDEDIYNYEGTDIYEVTSNEGYVVEIIVKEDGTVEIGNIVKGDNLPPRIGEITSSSTSNSIHVEVNITRSTGEVRISYYYKSNVTVTITAGSDGQSGANQVRYSVSGAQTVSQTDTAAGTTTATITITAEGTSTATNLSYTYTGLTDGTTYYLRVIVTDRAGNIRTGTTVTQATTSRTVKNILEEGDYVYYYDKNNTRRVCIVLYNTSSYGVQIITDDIVESVKLGNGTGTTKADYGTTEFNTAVNSYNNAISTLNTRAEAYLNTTYASDASCVGSVPNNKNSQSGYLTSSYSYMSSYSGKLRNTDNNYSTDYKQMGTLGIRDNGTYWLASRFVEQFQSSDTIFTIRWVGGETSNNLGAICHIWTGPNIASRDQTRGLRPVFTLKSGIKVTGGNGTESSPYTLGT